MSFWAVSISSATYVRCYSLGRAERVGTARQRTGAALLLLHSGKPFQSTEVTFLFVSQVYVIWLGTAFIRAKDQTEALCEISYWMTEFRALLQQLRGCVPRWRWGQTVRDEGLTSTISSESSWEVVTGYFYIVGGCKIWECCRSGGPEWGTPVFCVGKTWNLDP